MSKYSYEGKELISLFAESINWKKYFSKIIRPYISGDVLEIGCADGASTPFIQTKEVNSWTCMDPDPSLIEQVERRLKSSSLKNLSSRIGTIHKLSKEERFDTILYLDVLEHILNDADELKIASKHLRYGGKLIVLCPAHQFLYTNFDKFVGHHRRYSRKRLVNLLSLESKVILARYLDSFGMLASLGNLLLLNSSNPSSLQLKIWDSLMIPCSKILDPFLGYNLGKSVLVIWQKN